MFVTINPICVVLTVWLFDSSSHNWSFSESTCTCNPYITILRIYFLIKSVFLVSSFNKFFYFKKFNDSFIPMEIFIIFNLFNHNFLLWGFFRLVSRFFWFINKLFFLWTWSLTKLPFSLHNFNLFTTCILKFGQLILSNAAVWIL